ncbi:MAG: hypothetical protein ACF8AM_07105 [Rhodopirellula sp. JB055]|uniref:hypothetical protein n=1 Tax=Rhodopirellula sp. JB055 TaxID=3342846 RepID=UPI00370BE215
MSDQTIRASRITWLRQGSTAIDRFTEFDQSSSHTVRLKGSDDDVGLGSDAFQAKRSRLLDQSEGRLSDLLELWAE